MHAETWLRLLGQHFGEDGSIVEGARVVRAQMLRAGVQPQFFFFYDGSGLSPEDRITPRALTTLLRYIAEQPWGAEASHSPPRSVASTEPSPIDFCMAPCTARSSPRRELWKK